MEHSSAYRAMQGLWSISVLIDEKTRSCSKSQKSEPRAEIQKKHQSTPLIWCRSTPLLWCPSRPLLWCRLTPMRVEGPNLIQDRLKTKSLTYYNIALGRLYTQYLQTLPLLRQRSTLQKPVLYLVYIGEKIKDSFKDLYWTSTISDYIFMQFIQPIFMFCLIMSE